jgi:hypothetical protein
MADCGRRFAILSKVKVARSRLKRGASYSGVYKERPRGYDLSYAPQSLPDARVVAGVETECVDGYQRPNMFERFFVLVSDCDSIVLSMVEETRDCDTDLPSAEDENVVPTQRVPLCEIAS